MATTTAKRSGGRKKKKKTYADTAQVCAQPQLPPRPLPPDMHPGRLSLIRMNEKKWANGTILKYYFFDRRTDGDRGSWTGPQSQKNAVREAFQTWKDLGIGLEFREVSTREEAEVRIGFERGAGSWSYVGRDIIDFVTNPNERTMNFGWDLTTPYGRDTALHEIGHTLGFPHEHQNPNAGIVWDEAAVLQEFSGPPNNWTADKIRWNILRKLSQAEVEGSDWDPDSVMHYNFGPGLIVSPDGFETGLNPAGGLSNVDIATVRTFYPPLEEAREPELKTFESRKLMIGAGEQVNFRIKPSYSRDYTLQTFGRTDTVMVLFEDDGEDLVYLDGDDDSGWERNARVEVRLIRGREYVVRVRLYYADLSGESALMLW